MKAFILANIENEKNQVDTERQALEFNILDKLNKLREVEETYLLFGEWDILIKIKGINGPGELANFVLSKIRKIPEIKLTSTMIVAND